MSSFLKFPAPGDPNNSMYHITAYFFLKFGRWPSSNSLHPPPPPPPHTHTPPLPPPPRFPHLVEFEAWLKLNENCGRSNLLKILTYIGNIAQWILEWPRTQLKESLPIYMYAVPRNENHEFHPFRFTITHFQDIPHLRIFLFTPMLKFESDTAFITLGRLPKSNNTHFVAIANALTKVGWEWMKTAGSEAFWYFQPIWFKVP